MGVLECPIPPLHRTMWFVGEVVAVRRASARRTSLSHFPSSTSQEVLP